MLWRGYSSLGIGVLVFFIGFNFIYAGPNPVHTPTNREEYCSNVKQAGFAQELLLNSDNRLSFINQGGIGNEGVCWWHSRFTMSAAYSVVFKPKEPKPTVTMGRRLIRRIRKMEANVVIPGFKNLREFSSAFASELQSELDRWQLADGTWFGWLRGITGDCVVSAAELSNIMDDTFNKVEYQKRVVYQMLQLRGVKAHAWLVVKMKTLKEGYELTVVDSNFSAIQRWIYYRGITNFTYDNLGPFVPYSQNVTLEEEEKLRQVAKKFCSKSYWPMLVSNHSAESK